MLINFSSSTVVSDWKVVDDTVMGGVSDGKFEITQEGHAHFYGEVSTENNGGFSSVRHTSKTQDVDDYSVFKIRLKGDGKDYQFRAKSFDEESYSYVFTFSTSGEWQTIEVPFNAMQPKYRGRKLDKPNYPGEQLSEIAFLIGNKRNERFSLLVDKIELQ